LAVLQVCRHNKLLEQYYVNNYYSDFYMDMCSSQLSDLEKKLGNII
jgi:hypothetical protein